MPRGLYFMPTLNEGSADDSSTIQTVIDNMSIEGGGAILFPPRSTYKCNLTLKDDVLLVGQPTLQRATDTGAKLVANATGVVVDTPATQISNCGVVGFNIYGLGASTACKGVRFQNVFRGILDHVTAQNFADEGIVLGDDSLACDLEYCFTQDCLLDRSRAAKAGALDIGGADHYVFKGEYTTSQSALSDSNRYLAAVYVRATNCGLFGLIAEIADVGFYVTANPGLNRFIGCRADLNFSHGFEVDGGQRNTFTGCVSWRNSRETHNTYSGFYATSTSRLNLYVGCFAGGASADVGSLAMKYGFEDLVGAASGRNVYLGSRASGVQTNDYFVDGGGANWDTSTTVVA